jgi:hypothetical protein
VLTDGDARALEGWVVAANDWSEAAQGFVGAAGALALVSRTLAEELHGDGAALDASIQAGRHDLARDLRLLAETVEDETEELRDRYLQTAASIEGYQELLN